MKTLLVLALLAVGGLTAATPVRAQPDASESQEIDMLKGAGQACAFGGAVLGVSSLLVLYPALAGGAGNVPVVSIVLGNTLFGCGIAAVGALAARGFTVVYDNFFASSEEPANSESPRTAI